MRSYSRAAALAAIVGMTGLGFASAPAPTDTREQTARSAQTSERQAPQQQRGERERAVVNRYEDDLRGALIRRKMAPAAPKHRSPGDRQNKRRRWARRTRGHKG